MSSEMKSTREAAGRAILELAQEGADVVAVSADTAKSMFTTLLRDEYPDRMFDTGIAEQNMMMVAAGLASTGKIAFAASYSVFTSMRCCEQLRTFIAYPKLNVKVIAGIGGLSAGIEGVTHVSTEDLGIMRCIANMAVIAPSDYTTTIMAVKQAAKYDGPVYIRVGRDATPVLFGENYKFEIGKPMLHQDGKDILLVGQGLVMSQVLEAAKVLGEQGVDVGVIEVHTLKPMLDEQVIIDSALKSKRVITVEEHNVVGGLGTLVSELLCGRGELKMAKLGLQDTFAQSGTPNELLTAYGLDTAAIVSKAQDMLKSK